MSLPVSHTPIPLPDTGDKYAFSPPQEGHVRSVCPALNAMVANHGYIAPHGKNLSPVGLARGLKGCYGLSTFLAMFKYLLFAGKAQKVSFTMISPKGQTFAPIEIDHSLVDALVSDVKPSFKLAEIEKSPDPSAKFLMNYEDVARARIRRQGG